MTDHALGDRIIQHYRKFDGSPHWRFDTAYLGTDEHGIWLGGGPGDLFERPGRRFRADAHYVTLIPRDGFVATFNDESSAVKSRIYIDVMSVPEWTGPLVEAIDLDLDVVRRYDGQTLIDDEDEFADHQIRFGYPAELIATVRRTADDLLAAVRAEREPFGRVGFEWLAFCRESWPTPGSRPDSPE